MKDRLIAGTINYWADEEGWRNWHLDISPRPVWARGLEMAVLPHFVGDIATLVDFREDMFDEVRAHHVLEHLPAERGVAAVAAVHRVLKPGGVFDVEVPDLHRVCQAWLAGDLDLPGVQQWLYGEQLQNHEPGDSHRHGYIEHELRAILEQAGFEVGAREETGLALRFVAVKL